MQLHHPAPPTPVKHMDTLGIEPRAFRMQSGCDTTTPCARMNRKDAYGLCNNQACTQPTRIVPNPARHCVASTNNTSATGTRTRVARVRAEYPNQLYYSGVVCMLAMLLWMRPGMFLLFSGCVCLACAFTNVTPAGLEPAIPGSVGRCLIHWATGPLIFLYWWLLSLAAIAFIAVWSSCLRTWCGAAGCRCVLP